MYVPVSLCAFVSMRLAQCAFVCKGTHACVQPCVCVCIHVYVFVYVCMCLYTCVCVCISVSVCMCVCVCVHAFACVWLPNFLLAVNDICRSPSRYCLLLVLITDPYHTTRTASY